MSQNNITVDKPTTTKGDKVHETKYSFIGLHEEGSTGKVTIIAGNKRLEEPIIGLRKAKRLLKKNIVKYTILATLAYVEINEEEKNKIVVMD